MFSKLHTALTDNKEQRFEQESWGLTPKKLAIKVYCNLNEVSQE
jgi:hypothetical protein